MSYDIVPRGKQFVILADGQPIFSIETRDAAETLITEVHEQIVAPIIPKLPELIERAKTDARFLSSHGV